MTAGGYTLYRKGDPLTSRKAAHAQKRHNLGYHTTGVHSMNNYDNRSEYYASEHMAAHIDLERIEREEAMRKLRPAPRTLAEAFPDSPEAHFATYEAEISDFAWTVLGYVLAFFTGFFAAVLMM